MALVQTLFKASKSARRNWKNEKRRMADSRLTHSSSADSATALPATKVHCGHPVAATSSTQAARLRLVHYFFWPQRFV